MTRSEKLIASRFLTRAANEFSRHGCNDTDKALFEDITEEDKVYLTCAINEFNGSTQEDWMTFDQIPDFLWFAYFAHIVKW